MERIVFVDRVTGLEGPPETLAIDCRDVSWSSSDGFDHAAGLPFLLQSVPIACDRPPKEMLLVGADSETPSRELVEQTARLALTVAVSGLDEGPPPSPRTGGDGP
mgnify:CR=1 FL=1